MNEDINIMTTKIYAHDHGMNKASHKKAGRKSV